MEWKIINNLSGGNLQNITNKIIGMGSDHKLVLHSCQLIWTSNTLKAKYVVFFNLNKSFKYLLLHFMVFKQKKQTKGRYSFLSFYLYV